MFIYVNVPIGHDDWTWGSYIGVDRLKSGLDNYNGRYIGSLLIVILTRSSLSRIIIMPTIMTLIIYGIVFNTCKRDDENKFNLLMIVTAILILLTPINIFSQTYSWIAGFSNYVPPMVGIIMYFYLIREVFKEERDDISNVVNLIGIF